MIKHWFSFLLLTFMIYAETPYYLDPTQPLEARVEDLLSRLTLDEKLSLIHADSKFTAAGIDRLGIPVRFLSDGPHGVRQEIGPHSWAPAGRTDDYAGYLPNGTALASTWNPEMALEFGRVLGSEANARGKAVILGPAINIQRTPLCGRNFEYFGEDPYLTAQIVVPYIRGVQEQDVAACVKHFALNNQEVERGSISVEIDERALREIYLPGFQAAVQQGGVYTVMGAYNKLRGGHCCHNDYLLNTILKGEWGFQGLVVSDWSGTHDTREAALYGLDLEMGTDKPYADYFLADPFKELLLGGEIPMSVLDDKARRNLRVMFLTHVFDPNRKKGVLNHPDHAKSARKIADESIVLLKNDGGFLPL
ncbi:MAG: glycoside hydrolase family 3 protein [Calditrichaeota bacterium]|nr:MAG: glycoside hydrolase family 3 protein [Calditrichota bacterium]